jgi:predicted pyridoxine 5'-phosphate oxidase superfamily flavin-nucleotide-binding protein
MRYKLKREDDMAKLTEEAKKIISEFGPALIATASKTGKPNVSPKGSFRVLDEEHVVFANIASPRTIANLKENPQLTAIIFDRSTRKGCRIWGKAEIMNAGELFDTISAEYAKRNMKVRNVVKVNIDEAATF